MDALFVLLYPILLITAIVLSILPRNKGRRIKVFFLLAGIPPLIFFTDEIIGRAYLQAKCSNNGGYVYKELIKTEGYFDGDYEKGCGSACLEALTVRGFSYYETEVSSNNSYHAYGKGFYKYFLVDRGSGLCAGGSAISIERTGDKYSLLPDDKCVSYKMLIAPSSRYEVSMIRDSDIVKWPFRMTKVFSYIRDRKKDEITASATSYRYWGGWVRNNSFAHNSAIGCPSIKESHGAIKDIIIRSTAGKITPKKRF